MNNQQQNPAQGPVIEPKEEESLPTPVTSLTKLSEGVYKLTLLAPFFSPQMVTEINVHLDVLEDLKAEKISLITTSAHPKIFSSGGSLNYLSTAPREEVNSFFHKFCLLGARFVTLGFPTIAAINGYCIGLGVLFAMAHDFRYMVDTPGRFLSMPELNVAISFSHGHISLLTSKLKGEVVDKLLLQAQRFYQEEALSGHLVEKVLPSGELMETCRGLMEELLRRSIDSETMRSLKLVLYEDVVYNCRQRTLMNQEVLDYFVKVSNDSPKIT